MMFAITSYNNSNPSQKIYPKQTINTMLYNIDSWSVHKKTWAAKLSDGIIWNYEIVLFEFTPGGTEAILLDRFEDSNVYSPRILNA